MKNTMIQTFPIGKASSEKPEIVLKPRLASLNQSISNAQQRIPSKRTRPYIEGETFPVESAKPLSINENVSALTPKKETKRKRSSEQPLLPQQQAGTPGFIATRPSTRFSDLAGLDAVEKQIIELVCYPLQFPDIYSNLGICPPTGILLHGPSGDFEHINTSFKLYYHIVYICMFFHTLRLWED
jgi:SpoVK/Ycf46/Vps4 family AAA+-type ATPase